MEAKKKETAEKKMRQKEEQKKLAEQTAYEESIDGLKNKIVEIKKKITDIETEINLNTDVKIQKKLQKDKNSLLIVLRDTERKLSKKEALINIGGSTTKKHIKSKLLIKPKKTHKYNKIKGNKLTKKYKIMKRPRNTRKLY
jgi:hypothetical protein